MSSTLENVGPQAANALERAGHLPMIELNCDGKKAIGVFWGWARPASPGGIGMEEANDPIYQVEISSDWNHQGMIGCYPHSDFLLASDMKYPPFTPIVLTKPGLADMAKLAAVPFLAEAMAAMADKKLSHYHLDFHGGEVIQLYSFQFRRKTYLLVSPKNQTYKQLLTKIIALAIRGTNERCGGALGRAHSDTEDIAKVVERI